MQAILCICVGGWVSGPSYCSLYDVSVCKFTDSQCLNLGMEVESATNFGVVVPSQLLNLCF